jgi:hypothetical protein
MTNSKHDTIVGFIAGKMQILGFSIKYMEGDHSAVINIKPQLPPPLSSHRPDVFGTKNGELICIGEAKMPSDLAAKRTRTQLLEFTNLIRTNPNHLLILGIPQGSRSELTALLTSLGIVLNHQIDIIEIPLQFLPGHAAIL